MCQWSHSHIYSSNVHVAGTADAWAPVTHGSRSSCWHLDLPVHRCTENTAPNPWKELEMEFDKASPRWSSPVLQLVLCPMGSSPYQSLRSSRESPSHGFKMLGVPPAHGAEGLLGQIPGGAVSLPSSEELMGFCTRFTCGRRASLSIATQVKQNKLPLNCIPTGLHLLSTILPIPGEMFI